jgi:hypothetical protein
MWKVVIDIVLLPDEKAQKICRDMNKNIWGKIDFTNTWKVPHISLMMGVIDEAKIWKLETILQSITHDYSPIIAQSNLRAYNISTTWEDGYSFELEEHKDTTNLFKDISTQIRPMLGYENISTDMFYMPEEVEDQSVIWVKWFENRTPEEYSSHITLWIWELKWDNPNVFRFEANRIAVYQLGNYCTCDNQLFEINL